MIEIAKYEAMVRLTAIYPHSSTFVYPTLGLANEVGELLDKVFPTENAETANEATDEIVKEVGGCLWYLVATAKDLGVTVSELAHLSSGEYGLTTFEGVEWWLLETPKRRSSYLALVIASSELAGIAKKTIRDGTSIADCRERCLPLLGSALTNICLICKRLGVSLDYVARMNYDKLMSRKNRGKLKGDGDNR